MNGIQVNKRSNGMEKRRDGKKEFVDYLRNSSIFINE